MKTTKLETYKRKNMQFYNSTRKTPVSTSTVKGRLWDAGLLGRAAKKKPYLRLANKNKRLRWAKQQTARTQPRPRRPATRSRLFTVDVETGVLRGTI